MPDLYVVMPELILVGASLILIAVARRLQRTIIADGVTVAAAIASVLTLRWTVEHGAHSAFAGMIVLDAYAQFFKLLVAITLAMVVLLSSHSLFSRDHEDARIPRSEYHALLLLAASGMMLAVSSRDLLPLYLSLELMTICSYILVGLKVEVPASNEGAMKYFLLGSFASALLLFGISLTYGVTGSTDYAVIASVLGSQSSASNGILLIAIALVIAGLAFKIAAVPMHAWAPDAYQGASAPVAAFLAAGSKAVGLAALGRVCLSVYSFESSVLSSILAGLAGLSILVGSVVALSQSNMKRLLAYSSISHAGYALLGLVAGTPEGTSATMTYAFFYVFMTLGAFGVVIALGERGERLDGFQGLASQRPRSALLMLLFLMSLTGIPPTAGFTAKFAVILSAVRSGHIVLAILAVACSVISAFFYLRVAVFMYMNEPKEPVPARFAPELLVALAIAALITLVGGIYPGSLAAWAVAP